MIIVAEIIGSIIILMAAYYGGIAVLYRWMNGPKKEENK